MAEAVNQGRCEMLCNQRLKSALSTQDSKFPAAFLEPVPDALFRDSPLLGFIFTCLIIQTQL